MGLLRKVRAAGTPGSPVGDAPYDFASGLGEATWEFLVRTCWDEDGSRRETGTILVFSDGPVVKAMLNDRDGSRVAFLTLAAEECLSDLLERALLSPATDWRAAKKYVPPKKS
jgi:hypothetical protein